MTSSARRARAKRGTRSLRPASAATTGAAKSRKVTAEETGLPGRPKQALRAALGSGGLCGSSGKLSEDQRLAGLDADAGEVEARAGAGEGGLDEIEFACGDAAGDEQKIGSRRPGEGGIERVGVVAAMGRTQGSPPAAATMRPAWRCSSCESGRVWRGVDGNEFVAGGENGDARPAKTSSAAQPQDAARAICAAPIAVPAGSNASPLRACAPRATMFSPCRRCAGARGGWRGRMAPDLRHARA